MRKKYQIILIAIALITIFLGNVPYLANPAPTLIAAFPVVNLKSPLAITLDSFNRKMYWIDGESKQIQRANLDGSNAESLVISGLDNPRDLALDLRQGKMYWTDKGENNKILRANLDGNRIEILVTGGMEGIDNPEGIALDLAGGKMYWVNSEPPRILRANLDGSRIEFLTTTNVKNLRNIALDPRRGKMYWIDAETKMIQRANLMERIQKFYCLDLKTLENSLSTSPIIKFIGLTKKQVQLSEPPSMERRSKF